jgi:predicted dehydrogenase
MNYPTEHTRRTLSPRKPRLGFVGLGWIGLNRMASVVKAGSALVSGVQDVSDAAASEAWKLAPDAVLFSSFEDLLQHELDGLVIATPNRFHAEQAIAGLQRGLAVFCQKPLGRNAFETRQIVAAARDAGCLLGVDLSYRSIPAMQTVSRLVQTGALGKVFAVDAKFHNAYGPDKPWFYDYTLSGGGCLLDLGVHLIDLALTPLGYPAVIHVEGTSFSGGRVLSGESEQVEDYCVATIQTADDAVINVSSSWNLHAGRAAKISVTFYGTEGGASLHNVDGSFFDFVGERFHGTETERLNNRADSEWGGLATLDWVSKLATKNEFDADIARVIAVAEIIDRVYGHEQTQEAQ